MTKKNTLTLLLLLLFQENGASMIDKMNDIRVIGLLALVLIFLITMIGLDWVMHTQSFLLLLLVAAIVTVIAGTVYPSPRLVGFDSPQDSLCSHLVR